MTADQANEIISTLDTITVQLMVITFALAIGVGALISLCGRKR